MSDTTTDLRVELRFNPTDAAALLRVVDPEGVKQGTDGVFVVADENVEPSFVNVLVTGEGAEEWFPAERQGLQKVMTFDPFTGAIITLAHNQVGDIEATKPWARDIDGVNALDTEAGKTSFEALIGVEVPELFRIATQHAQHQALTEMLARLNELPDDDEVDVVVLGDEHHHPETLTEHGGEG